MLFTLTGTAQTRYITQDGFFACEKKSDFETITSYAVAEDIEAVKKIVASLKCIVLQGGVEVQIMDTAWGLAKIRPIGHEVTVWTNSEAVKRKK